MNSKQALQRANEQRHRLIFAGGLVGIALWLYVSSGSSPIDPDSLVEGFDTSVDTTTRLIVILVDHWEQLAAAGAIPVLAWAANRMRKK